ncbi:ATP citrate synthase [Candidatus Woesearchaeota archaeon]|nr:ATP citrate synthase [Candidatus Woesearchaeota archaeon]
MNDTRRFTAQTQALFYNLKAKPLQQMLDFDYLCQRTTPSVAGIIHPERKGFHKAFFGSAEILIPIYTTLQEAVMKQSQADVLVNFASFRSVYASVKEALSTPSIKTIIIVAEGVSERQTKELIALAAKNHKMIIGPSTVGGIAAGAFRLGGYAGGEMENLLRAKLYRSGSVGLVSKSGGMMNELFNIISRATDGIKEGIAIGGDRYPGSTLLDHILRYETDLDIKLIVALGELGGAQEYEIIQAKKEGKITKPLVMWISGTCADIFSWEVQFGHAGARAGNEQEQASKKNEALREAGIIVPESFAQLENTIAHKFTTLKESGIIRVKEEVSPPVMPMRNQTHFTTTISDDRGDEPTYCTIPISTIIEENKSIGDVISLLWFKKKVPKYFSHFMELCLILCADHGPAVSGAHNAIVSARAGKDVISSLCSGLLTIGPRFGGAIDDASRYFKEACDKNQPPEEFVEMMKKKGIPIPGIGHRVKSKQNPDKRVELLKEFGRKNFPATQYLNYVLEVETETLKKADNLILNIDGCMAALFLDALVSAECFTQEEINQIIEIGYMNGLFALARSIGIIGHIFDQKRLGEGLYRHPTEDILYLHNDENESSL